MINKSIILRGLEESTEPENGMKHEAQRWTALEYAKNVMSVDIRRIRWVVLLDGMALNIENGLRMTVVVISRDSRMRT